MDGEKEITEGDKEKILLPSEVTEKRYIRLPNEDVVESDEEWLQCGKWIWKNHGNFFLMDKVWTDLQCLLKSGIIIMMKASTAQNTVESGVVMCFTRPGKDEVRRAADAIRNIIKSDYIMYYKTNDMTENNFSRRSGCDFISEYMYTPMGRFYVRDHLNRWKLDGNTLCIRTAALSFQDETCNADFTERPPVIYKTFLSLENPTYRKNAGPEGYWYLQCDTREPDINGWLEDVRVWKVAEHLLNEGVFTKIMYGRKKRIAYISCYMSDYSDIKSIIECAEKIIRRAHYVSHIHFHVTENGNIFHKYKYTAEGELIEFISTGHKFDLNAKFVLQQ